MLRVPGCGWGRSSPEQGFCQQTMPKIVRISLIISLNTFLLLVFSAELYTRYLVYHYDHSSDKASPYLQKILLYRDVNHFMDTRNHDDLNSDHIRHPIEATSIKAEDHSIIFLGDSFIYGFMLSHRAAIPYQFEEIARAALPGQMIHGINFGWVSASPYIEIDLLKKLGQKYQPDVVIVDLDLGDFHDDIYYRVIRERRSIYTLASWLPCTTWAIEMLAMRLNDANFEKLVGYPKSQLFVNERSLEQSLPYIRQYTEKNLDALHEYSTKTLGAKFIVFVNPKTFHYNEKEAPNNWLKAIVKRTEYSFEIFDYIETLSKEKPYPVISLLPAFQRTTVFPTAFDKDAHWNRDGYKVAAMEMFEQCQQLGCFTHSQQHQ